MASEPHSPGWVAGLRHWADALLGVVQTRVELFALEFREERTRGIHLLLHISLAFFLGMMAVLALTVTVVLLAPEHLRVYAAGAFGILYLTGALWAFFSLRARLGRDDHAFPETIREFKKDRDWLQAP